MLDVQPYNPTQVAETPKEKIAKAIVTSYAMAIEQFPKNKRQLDILLELIGYESFVEIIINQIFLIPTDLTPINQVNDRIMQAIQKKIILESVRNVVGDDGLRFINTQTIYGVESNFGGIANLWKFINKNVGSKAFEPAMLPMFSHNFVSQVSKALVSSEKLLQIVGQIVFTICDEYPEILSYGKKDVDKPRKAHAVCRNSTKIVVQSQLDTPAKVQEMELDADVVPNTILSEALDILRNYKYNLDADYQAVLADIMVVEDEDVEPRPKEEFFSELVGDGNLHKATVKAKVKAVRAQIGAGVKEWKQRGCVGFYSNWKVDFRTRIYQLGSVVGIAPKIVRSMLRSAEAFRLGDTGLSAMYIQVAGDLGYDKRSFDEREAIGSAARGKLELIGEELLANPTNGFKLLQDLEPDNIWNLAVFAIELHRIKQWEDAGHATEDYKTTVFCNFDATSSGLQIVAATLYSKDLLKAVNMSRDEDQAPGASDVYALLGDCMARTAEQTPSAEHTVFLELDPKKRRALAKALLMKAIYGSSFLTKHRDAKSLLLKYAIECEVKETATAFAKLFSLTLQQSDEFKPLFETMVFLRSLIAAYNENGWQYTYMNPITNGGDKQPITYKYTKESGVKKDFTGNGKKRTVCSYGLRDLQFNNSRTEALEPTKAKSSVTPSTIHAMDASILGMSIIKMGREFPLMLIHDCLAVTPSQAKRLRDVTKEVLLDAFTQQGNLLADLQQQCFEATGVLVDLPECQGQLEDVIAGMQRMEYAFC